MKNNLRFAGFITVMVIIIMTLLIVPSKMVVMSQRTELCKFVYDGDTYRIHYADIGNGYLEIRTYTLRNEVFSRSLFMRTLNQDMVNELRADFIKKQDLIKSLKCP